MQDVARLAGVSPATVSYVLNGRRGRTQRSSPDVQQRVREAVDVLGYRVNRPARMLRRVLTELVAIVYRPPSGPWLEQLIRQTENFANQHRYTLICVPIYNDDQAELSLQVITRGYVDGVIMAHVLPEQLDSISDSANALIVFGDDIVPTAAMDVVRVNVRAAFADATQYLRQQGRRRIAFIQQNPPDKLRFLGYADALAEVGETPRPDFLLTASSEQSAVPGLRALLERDDRPDALMCESDRIALTALHVAREAGLEVPFDLAITGAGNTSLAGLADPPLTSVGTPLLDFTPAISALFERISDPSLAPRELSLAWTLNIRQTT